MSGVNSYEIDMHTHTINSDGRNTPYEVIDIAVKSGIKILTFTDHSGITHSNDIVGYAKEKGISIPFMGLEVSTIFEGNKYHVLGYGKNLRIDDLEDYLLYPTEVKNKRFIKIIEALRDIGIVLPSNEDIRKGIRPDGTFAHPDKWMLTRTLVATYVAQNLNISINEAKGIFSDSDDPKNRRIFIEESLPVHERYLPTTDVISYLAKKGAGVILAHPWWECGRGNTTERVKSDIFTFAELGLHGLECESYHLTQEMNNEIKDIFRQLPHFHRIGGSDFHGDRRSSFGHRGVTWEDYHAFSKVISI